MLDKLNISQFTIYTGGKQVVFSPTANYMFEGFGVEILNSLRSNARS